MAVRFRTRGGAFLLLLAALILGCSGDGEVRACFGAPSFCERALDFKFEKDRPRADAGDDRQVASGAEVVLDGTGSRDDDGRIVSFAWTQLSGMPVAIEGATRSLASFVAPDVAASTALEFRLTVVDDDGAADRDRVTVTVVPAATMALQNGLALLEDVLVPAPLTSRRPCRAAREARGDARLAFIGLWVAARTLAVKRDDPHIAVSRLLDAGRVLFMSDVPAPAGGRDASALARFGIERLSRFAAVRDPALAEAGHRRLAGLPASAGVSDALIGGEVVIRLAPDARHLRIEAATPDIARRAAIVHLNGAACGTGLDPVRVAAETVLLLCREGC